MCRLYQEKNLARGWMLLDVPDRIKREVSSNEGNKTLDETANKKLPEQEMNENWGSIPSDDKQIFPSDVADSKTSSMKSSDTSPNAFATPDEKVGVSGCDKRLLGQHGAASIDTDDAAKFCCNS